TQAPTNESPSQATARLLSQWSGCMTKGNFDTADMANQWANMQASNNETCKECHVNGAEGFIATNDSTYMFSTVDTNKYYMLEYFTVDLSKGTAMAKVIINQTSFMGVSQGQDPHREHPRFDALNGQGMAALQTFYDSTMSMIMAGGCGPSQLAN